MFALAALVALTGCASNEGFGTVVGEATTPPTTLTLGRSDDGAPLEEAPDEETSALDDGDAIIPDPGVVDTESMDPALIGEGWELAFSNRESLDPASFDSTNECQIETPAKIDGEIHFYNGPDEAGFLELIFEAPEEDLAGWVESYRQLGDCEQLENGEMVLVGELLDVDVAHGADEVVGLDLTITEPGGTPVDHSILVMARYGDVLLVGIAPDGPEEVDTTEIARRLDAAADAGGLS